MFGFTLPSTKALRVHKELLFQLCEVRTKIASLEIELESRALAPNIPDETATLLAEVFRQLKFLTKQVVAMGELTNRVSRLERGKQIEDVDREKQYGCGPQF